MTVAEALAAAATLGVARLDAQLLLLHALGRRDDERAWLLAHDDDVLSAVQQARFMSHCERRCTGEPVAYLVGHKEFYGLRLRVDRHVLVPRPDTETLVDWALEVLGCARTLAYHQPTTRTRAGHPHADDLHAHAHPDDSRRLRVSEAHPSIADLGTGSGAIALAIKKHCPCAHVVAIDSSEEALRVARSNAGSLRLEVDFRHGDWLGGVTEQFDLIASNPPYVAAADPHLAHLGHEPIAALAAGPDGLDDIRRIVGQSLARLHPGGWLLLEHGWDQAAAVRVLLDRAGFADVQSRTDLAGIERCSGGRRPELG